MLRHLTWLTIVALFAGFTSPGRAADSREMRAAGSHTALWLTRNGTAPDSGSPTVSILRSNQFDIGHAFWQELPPLQGTAECVSADRESLYVEFSSGSIVQVSSNSVSPVRSLPESSQRLAWAGDILGRGVYAVVKGTRSELNPRQAVSSATTDNAGVVATQPDETPAVSSQAAATEITNADEASDEIGLHLMHFNGGRWIWVTQVPADFIVSSKLAMTARDGRVLLVDSEDVADAAVVRSIEWQNDQWSELKVVSESVTGLLEIRVGWPTNGAVAMLIDSVDGKSATAGITPFRRTDGTWKTGERVRSDDDAVFSAPLDTWDLTIAAESMVVVSQKADQKFTVGGSTISDKMKIQWTASGSSVIVEPPQWSGYVSFVGLAILIAMLLFVRSDKLLATANLPSQMILAAPMLRIVAALIDMIPAVIITAFWWYPELQAAFNSGKLAAVFSLTDEKARQFVNIAVWVRWIGFVSVYCIYAFAWEAIVGITPGKWLFGMVIVNEDGGRVTLRQAALRNVTRWFELGINVPLIAVVSAMVLFFWSNRKQRIGDIVAHTLVVVAAQGRLNHKTLTGKITHAGDGDPRD